VTFARGSRARLTRYDLGRFAGGRLLDRVGRAVCRAGCLPRKELFEAWEIARRVRRVRRGGRVIDVAGGHGLLAHLMLLLDDSSPGAVVLDPAVPASGDALHAALVRDWPRLAGRVSFAERDLAAFAFESGDVIVSSHACGALTDRILDAAIAARAFVAVLPCCHDLATCDTGGLDGWIDGALAVDAVRAMKLARHAYRVRTQLIPADITPRNRLLLGEAECGEIACRHPDRGLDGS
jgi:hypothetical protein